VSRSEFNLLLRMIEQMQNQMVKTHTLLAELSDGGEGAGTGVASASTTTPTTTSSKAASSKPPKTSTTGTSAPPEKKKAAKRKIEAMAPDEPSVRALPVNDDNTPLTMEEQELLTETINELPPEHLDAVAQIIREAAPVGANDDEIDLEIDDLDISTQRKLLRHVSKVCMSTAVVVFYI
jgi:Bromodomain extra-terminal - transcription regulation